MLYCGTNPCPTGAYETVTTRRYPVHSQNQLIKVVLFGGISQMGFYTALSNIRNTDLVHGNKLH